MGRFVAFASLEKEFTHYQIQFLASRWLGIGHDPRNAKYH
jgi:hypothetical protein